MNIKKILLGVCMLVWSISVYSQNGVFGDVPNIEVVSKTMTGEHCDNIVDDDIETSGVFQSNSLIPAAILDLNKDRSVRMVGVWFSAPVSGTLKIYYFPESCLIDGFDYTVGQNVSFTITDQGHAAIVISHYVRYLRIFWIGAGDVSVSNITVYGQLYDDELKGKRKDHRQFRDITLHSLMNPEFYNLPPPPEIKLKK